MEIIELLQVLDNVLDGFDNKSNIKYHLLKEQIENKISIIKHFIYYGFPILNYNHQEQLDILYCLKFAGKITDIDNMINDIIKNIYGSSGYQLLLTNIPTKAKIYNIGNVNNVNTIDTIESVNAERIYDTLELYVGEDNIESIFQVSTDTYLAKFQLDSDAQYISNLINNKMIDNNIITVKYIMQIVNIKDSTYMDDSMIYIESDNIKYENEFKDIELLNLVIENEPNKNDEYKYIEPLTSSKSIENNSIIDVNKPIIYKIDNIDDIDDIDEDNSYNENKFCDKKEIITNEIIEDDGWKIYVKYTFARTLFNNIVGSISNKFNTISKYFRK